MIKADEDMIRINGEMATILTEFSNIIEAMYGIMTDKGYSDEFAREMIAWAGRLAFMTKEEIEENIAEKEKELMELVKSHEEG